MRTDEKVAVKLSNYAPPAYGLDRVELRVRLKPQTSLITAMLAFMRAAHTPDGTPLVLHGDGVILRGVSMDGAALAPDAYHADAQGFILHHPPAHAFTLTFETEVKAEGNSQFMGLYRSSGIWCTQCEAEGFRRITYMLDRPDVMSVYTTRIEALKTEAPVLLGNGNCIESGDLPDGRHYAVWHDPHPKPAYLFALVGGRLASVHDTFTTRSGRRVALGVYVEEGKQDRCAYAMEALKRSMRWDEEVFGCEYDLDVFNIVAVSDFNMGAMENKGLNIFNDKYILALPDTATDVDYDNIERIIAHEYFHNWTGNRITCRDWFQLCLKEGLTVYRDQEFSSDMRSRTVKRIEDVRTLRSRQFPEDAGPLAHPVRPQEYFEIDNFYTPTIYEKGAEIIRMLRRLIGDDAFWRGMALYFSRHDGEACTIEQFIACFAESSGRDLAQFSLWYAQSGTPELHVSKEHDAATGLFTLRVRQVLPPTPGQPVKQPMVIPLMLGLVGANGQDRALTDAAGKTVPLPLVVDESEKVFVLSGHPSEPVLSLNRGFAAPVTIISPVSDADRQFLARHDSDGFNRWEAAQGLYTRWLINESRSSNHASAEHIIAVMGGLVADGLADPAFTAQALTLPGELDIARDMGEAIDPDAIHRAFVRLEGDIARALRPQLLELAGRIHPQQPFSPDAGSAGQRALHNLALALAAGDGDTGVLDRMLDNGLHADNMSDRAAMLKALAGHATSHRDTLLAAYHARHKDDAIALDKWFTVQATISEHATLERVMALMEAPEFSLRNPNRARALIGGFAMANPVGFARPDGAGFRFVATVLTELDGLNSQTAARILGAFKSWKAFEPGRRDHAERALHFLAAQPLSSNCRDIVERCLKG